MTIFRMSLSLLCTLFIGGAACSPDFDPIWLVKDLRILAINADPPEVLLPAEEMILPSAETFPEVLITPLVVDPLDPEGLFDWELWACTAEEDGCDEAAERVLITRRSQTPLSEITAGFKLQPELFFAAFKADPLKGFGGVPVMVDLKVNRGAFSDRAYKRLVYGTFLPADKTPNENPAISRILADAEELPQPLSVERDAEMTLLPESLPEDKEDYLAITFTGQSKELSEYLEYSFFTTMGQLTEAKSGGQPSPFVEFKRVTDLSSTWTAELPPEATLPQEVTFWIVVRDDRGGVSWRTFTAQVK